MLVGLIYLLVILIWATTPLAIKLGGDSLSPVAGLSMRITLAFIVGSVLLTLFGRAGLNFRLQWKLYLAASISLFPNMLLVYMATQYLSSGLVALLFGLTPLVNALLSKPILGESGLNRRKSIAICLALLGLMLIFSNRTYLGEHGHLGIALMLFSNLLFSTSALWVKRLNRKLDSDPFQQAMGAMTFALPGLLLSWWVVGGSDWSTISVLSWASLFYLALVGSLVGIVAYYFLLNRLAVEQVSLIPLVTPLLAMGLGVLVAGEQVTLVMLGGAVIIIAALALHQAPWERRNAV